MDIRPLSPDDSAAVPAAVALTNAAQRVDAPFEHPVTVDGFTSMLRHGWDGEVPEAHAAWEQGRLAGLVSLYVSEWDNKHVAWVELLVHPDLRGHGRGTELLEFAEARTEELGRTSVGLFGWDSTRTQAYAHKQAFPRKGVAVKRRQVLSQVVPARVDRLRHEAAAAASAYDLVHIAGSTPRDLLGAVAEMTAAINDSPTDDLDIEDEVYPVERVVAYESAQAARRKRLHRVVARHRESGALAGHTVVAVDAERPWIADQHDTSVVEEHRGHRLGLLLKASMLELLVREEPQVATIDTWNMESNDFMISINEQLGYEPLGREVYFQRDLRQAGRR